MRALIVALDETARREVADLLDEFGFDCFEADDGIGALQFASDDAIDLIVTDIHLPRLDGPLLLDIVTEGAFGRTPPPLIVCAATLHQQVWAKKIVLPGVAVLGRSFTSSAFAAALDTAFPAE